jgi:hypothetical protein
LLSGLFPQLPRIITKIITKTFFEYILLLNLDYLLICTKGFSNFENWRQLACYAGVAPFEHASGTSLRGKTKVSPMADKKRKSLLIISTVFTLVALTIVNETGFYIWSQG